MGNGQHSSRHALRPQGHPAPSAQAKEQLAAPGLRTHARRRPRRLECLEKKGISLTCASITPSDKGSGFSARLALQPTIHLRQTTYGVNPIACFVKGTQTCC